MSSIYQSCAIYLSLLLLLLDTVHATEGGRVLAQPGALLLQGLLLQQGEQVQVSDENDFFVIISYANFI